MKIKFCCPDCEFLSITEMEQNNIKDGNKESHICKKYNKRLVHGIYHPELVKLDECIKGEPSMEKNCGNCRFSKDICSKEGMCWFRPGPGYPDWQPIEEEKTMENIQEPLLTEDQARTILLTSKFIDSCEFKKGNAGIFISEIILDWKEKGYIKKTALEYAEEYQELLSSGKVEYYTVEQFNRQKELYQFAIKELQEGKK